MRTIQAKPLTLESFQPYGTFTDVMNPSGFGLGTYFHDRLKMSVSGRVPVAFCPFIIHKPEKNIVVTTEYHNYTQEGILCLDDDIVIHVAPASAGPVPELTEAFLVPKGTLVLLNLGVWHYGPTPANLEDAHALIILPERTYMNDCIVTNYEPEDQIEITL